MYNLPEGQEVDIQYLNKAFDSMTTSYKIFCFKSIYDEVIKENYEISYRTLVCNMIVNAWYPVLKYNLNFGKADQLGKIINSIYTNSKLGTELAKEKLFIELEKIVTERQIKELLTYVLFRIIRPTFESELKGIKTDYEQQKKIEVLCKENRECIYRVDQDRQQIILNNSWFKYIKNNQSIVGGWIKYNLIDFLQKRNPNVPSIIYKLEPEIERELEKVKPIYKKFISKISVQDIYSDKILTIEDFKGTDMISIDHFIPWSFIGHDMMWNLTPTLRSINSSKNDNLPNWDRYFNKFVDQQYLLFNYLLENSEDKFLEDYLIVFKDLDINKIKSNEVDITKSEFKQKLENVINPSYQIAINQGFSVWENTSIQSKEIQEPKYYNIDN